MCGIFALAGNGPEDLETVVRCLALQNNRGHDSLGIESGNGHGMNPFRHLGLVRDACNDKRPTYTDFVRRVLEARDHVFIGHVRYSTVGVGDLESTMPLVLQAPRWGRLALVHNGQIANHARYAEKLQRSGYFFRSTSDSEILLADIARSNAATLPAAVAQIMRNIPGVYSMAVMDTKWLVACRDRTGCRPLWHQFQNGIHALASERAALPFPYLPADEINPGEMFAYRISDGHWYKKQVVEPDPAYCIFELMYFSRPDQIIARKAAGHWRRELGREAGRACGADADVICYVPDSGMDAGLGLADVLHIPFEPRCIVRNNYAVRGRTFILEKKRRMSDARSKYSVTADLVRGQRVTVADDTIVKATTAPIITEMLFEAGAREVHWRVAAPPPRQTSLLLGRRYSRSFPPPCRK